MEEEEGGGGAYIIKVHDFNSKLNFIHDFKGMEMQK